MSEQAAAAVSLTTPRVAKALVVDGDSVAREAIAETLTAAGYDVVSTGAAARALEIVRDDEISLVVSEFDLPDFSGLELLEAMRRQWPSLPILLVRRKATVSPRR